jgi:hypothetical protein
MLKKALTLHAAQCFISGDLNIAKWLLIYSKNVIIAQQVIMTLTP